MKCDYLHHMHEEIRLREIKHLVKDIIDIIFKNVARVFRTSDVLFLKQYYSYQDLWTLESEMRSQSKNWVISVASGSHLLIWIYTLFYHMLFFKKDLLLESGTTYTSIFKKKNKCSEAEQGPRRGFWRAVECVQFWNILLLSHFLSVSPILSLHPILFNEATAVYLFWGDWI